MPSLWRARLLSALPVCLAAAAVIPVFARQTPQTPAAPAPATSTTSRESFSGRWVYNEEDSVNAATGRQELGTGPRRPLSAGATTPAPRGPADPASPTPPPPSGTEPSRNPPVYTPGSGPVGVGVQPPAGFSGASMDGGGFGMGGLGSALAMAELRDTQRDLLEMARRWTITVAADSVTFKDDLDRERTYPSNGKKQKYQLGAAQYTAKLQWDGPKLIKEIEASYGFHMTETYSLSTDGSRLFAIIRVLGKGKNPPVVGANRVYDRIQ